MLPTYALGMAAAPDWLASSEETRAALAGWARERRLDYAESGLLPPVSDHLRAGLGVGPHVAGVQHGRGALIRYSAATVTRPERFSESLCTGVLPGGLEGTLAHHSFLFRHRASTLRWDALGDTVVAARVPETARVTRELAGRPRTGVVVTVTGPEYGEDTKQLDLTPALGERLRWEVDADEDSAALEAALGPAAIGALEATPALTRICVRDGWLTVETQELQSDPEVLDALCRAASALAAALRSAASALPEHGPEAGPLPEPPETPYRRWLAEGADRVAWPDPPPDVRTAVEAYLAVSGDDPHAERRGRRGFAVVFGLIAGLGLVPAALAFAVGGAVVGLPALCGVLLLAFGLALVVGRGARRGEVRSRAQAWGREAFAREHAWARGLRIEDAEQVRRRIPLPLPGRPERSLYGPLGDGVDGRIVLWRDRTDPESGDRALNLALVPAPGDGAPEARAPYAILTAGRWLVVAHDLGTGARTAADLDALAAEAARLARPGRA